MIRGFSEARVITLPAPPAAGARADFVTLPVFGGSRFHPRHLRLKIPALVFGTPVARLSSTIEGMAGLNGIDLPEMDGSRQIPLYGSAAAGAGGTLGLENTGAASLDCLVGLSGFWQDDGDAFDIRPRAGSAPYIDGSRGTGVTVGTTETTLFRARIPDVDPGIVISHLSIARLIGLPVITLRFSGEGFGFFKDTATFPGTMIPIWAFCPRLSTIEIRATASTGSSATVCQLYGHQPRGYDAAA